MSDTGHAPLLEQWSTARKHPAAAVLGGWLGSIPPTAAYVVSHVFLLATVTARDPLTLRALVQLPVLVAAMLFSVRTVWLWGRSAFGDVWKASCLVVTLEGAMVTTPTPAGWLAVLGPLAPWLGIIALLSLIVINAIASACNLAREQVRAAPPTVTTVAREQNLPRRAAEKVVDAQLAARRRPVARPA